MTPMLSGDIFIFRLVFFVLKSLLGIARQWSREKFAILFVKPWCHMLEFFIERGLFRQNIEANYFSLYCR